MDHLADAPIANILILAGVVFLAVGLFGRIGGFIGSIFGNIEAGQNSRVLAGVLGVSLVVGGGWMHEESHKSASSTPAPTAPPTTTSVTPNVSPAPNAAPTTTATPPTTPNAARDPKQPAAPAPRPAPKTQSSPSVALSEPSLAAERESLPAPAPRPIFDDLVGVWNNLTPRGDGIKRIEFARVGQNLDAHLWYGCPSGECDKGRYPVMISGTALVFEWDSNGIRRVGTFNLHTPNVLLLTMDLSGALSGAPATGERVRNHWVMVKPTLSNQIQGALRLYFSKPQHRAFALAPRGDWGFQGGESVERAEEHALDLCKKYGAPGCRVILVDDDPK